MPHDTDATRATPTHRSATPSGFTSAFPAPTIAPLTLVTGAARSGKSRYAESRAIASTLPVTYLATATASDDEMRARIDRHRSDRPAHWHTIEEPVDLARALEGTTGLVLLDCLTLWVTNMMLCEDVDWTHDTVAPDIVDAIEGRVFERVEALLALHARGGFALIAVTNEVGWGLVPANPFGRAFRDIAGRVNQRMAQAADDVLLAVDGLPLPLKRAGRPVW